MSRSTANFIRRRGDIRRAAPCGEAGQGGPRPGAGHGARPLGRSMPGGRRGLVAPQNTFLENIIRRSSSQREYRLPEALSSFQGAGNESK